MPEQTVILTAAVTGAVHIPSMSPYLPITPEQIIDEAVAACQAGAAVVHLHTRDPRTGQPTGDPGLMKQVVDGVRARCGVVIGVTTGGAIGMTSEERLAAGAGLLQRRLGELLLRPHRRQDQGAEVRLGDSLREEHLQSALCQHLPGH